MESKVLRILLGSVIFAAGLFIHYFTDTETAIQFVFFGIGYLIVGYDVILEAFESLVNGKVFNEDILMSIATIGAFVIGAYPEALAVMLFFQIGEELEDIAVSRSRRSIRDLMDIQSETANLKTEDGIRTVDSKELVPGNIIVIKPGEKVPADGKIIDGRSALDTKVLTGESLPRDVYEGESVLSGCVNLSGLLTVEVTKTSKESTAAKTLDLIENATEKKAKSERFLTVFSRYYTPAVVGCAVLVAVIPPLLFSMDWSTWIYRALVILVISCPCALVISVPMTFFAGIGAASKQGILIKGSNYLEALSKADIVAMDKTGTLTKGSFTVKDIRAVGMSNDELVEIVAKAENYSDHPISASVRDHYGKGIGDSVVSDAKEIAGMGISSSVDGKTVHVGNSKLMDSISVEYEKEEVIGATLYVSVDGEYAGRIIISDEEKEDAEQAIRDMKAEGVRRTVLLTGDNDAVGKAVAEKLGIDEAYTEMLPADKVSKVEELMDQVEDKGKLIYVGDGINDAPVLARSDVGIAMGGFGSDAAVEAADVVIMTDEPSKVPESIRISKKTMRIAKENTIFAIAVKFIVLAFAACGLVSLWVGVFADVGLMILAVLNAMRAMRTSKSHKTDGSLIDTPVSENRILT